MRASAARASLTWRLSHWARLYGHQPTLDDLVVPTRNGTPVDSVDAVHAFKADLEALGLRVEAGERRDLGGHDLRGWYKTRCIEDGADSLIIRRTTHAPPRDGLVDMTDDDVERWTRWLEVDARVRRRQ